MTHNTAILIFLLQNNQKWVSIKDIRIFTDGACRSECYKVGTRISDLRVKYNYPILNKKEIKDGVVFSSYKINLNQSSLNKLRSLYPFKNPPNYNKVIGMSAGIYDDALIERIYQ